MSGKLCLVVTEPKWIAGCQLKNILKRTAANLDAVQPLNVAINAQIIADNVSEKHFTEIVLKNAKDPIYVATCVKINVMIIVLLVGNPVR